MEIEKLLLYRRSLYTTKLITIYFDVLRSVHITPHDPVRRGCDQSQRTQFG